MPLALRRAWDAPVAAHLAALLLVLIGGAVYVGTHASLSTDEGAAIVQARQLSEHGDWIRPHPYPELDPEGRNYPYELSERGTEGFAPFAKHPLYALVLSWLWPVGGIKALVGFSIAATVAAAAVAARFARRVDAALERPALWALGLGSPLLFDSYLVIAHTVGAAIAGALLLVVTRRSTQRPTLAIGAAAVLAASLVLMRTEGVLFVGVVAVVGLVGARSRSTAVTAAAAGVAGVLARFAEKAWTEQIVGPPVRLTLNADEAARESAMALGGGGLRGRFDGAALTLFRPEYGNSRATALLVVALIALAAAVVLGRRDARLAEICGLLAAALAVVRLVVEPSGLVPGLFVATPIVWAGLWAGLAAWREVRVDLRLVAVVIGFSGAVLATQYARGGGIEWGWRFFALALPVAVPLALTALRTQPAVVVRCVVVAAVAMSLLALRTVHDVHRNSDTLYSALRVPAGAVPVTTVGVIPRLDWQRYDQRQWLLVRSDDVAELLTRLERRGAERVFLLYPATDRPDGVTGEARRVAETRWRTLDITLD